MAKNEDLFRACTRGCDVALGGHVALPRGQAPVPAWHRCDVYSYYIHISMVIVHISIHIWI